MPSNPRAPVIQFYVNRQGQELGPYTRIEIQVGIDARKFSRTDLVWCKGRDGWVPLGAEPAFSFGHIPPPIHTAPFKTPIRWLAVLRDAAVIFGLSVGAGFISSLAVNLGMTRYVIIGALSNVILCTAGWAVSSCS